MALAQLVDFAAGRGAARELLREIGAGGTPEARVGLASRKAAEWLERLPLLPLYAEAPRLAVREGVARAGFDAAGAPALADAWLMGAPAP